MNHWIIHVRSFVITVALCVLIIAAFGLASVSFWRSHTAAAQDRMTLCRAQNASNQAIRSVLLLAQASPPSRQRTPDQQARIAAFYAKALAKVPTIDCSHLAGGNP
jgi:hypothetical protein